MSVLLTSSYVLSETLEAPAWHTRIGWNTIARKDGAAITASSTDSGSYAEAPVTDQTFEWWQPTSLPATWEVDAGEAVDVDYVGIAAHELATCECAVKVQHSDDGSAWSDVPGAERAPGTDGPLMMLFDEVSARYWRIRITGTAEPRIGVIYIGKALAMQRPVQWNGHTPGVMNRVVTKRPAMSDRGQYLGTTIIREGFEVSYEANNLDEDWVRETFDDFAKAAIRCGYFIAWRPTQFPKEVLFGWTENPIVPTNTQGGRTRRMGVSWSMRAHGGYESGIVPWG